MSQRHGGVAMPRERRKFVRAPHGLEAKYHPAFGNREEGWRAVQTVNLSAGGIRFRSADPLAVGKVLDLDITLPSVGRSLPLRGCVVWSRMPASGLTEHGVAFTDLTLEQMVQLEEFVQWLTTYTQRPTPLV